MTRTAPLAAALVALLVAACATTPPPASLADLPDLPAEWDKKPLPLPDIPTCPTSSRTAWLACRAAYDGEVRAQYVAVANRYTAVAGWIRVARARGLKAG